MNKNLRENIVIGCGVALLAVIVVAEYLAGAL